MSKAITPRATPATAADSAYRLKHAEVVVQLHALAVLLADHGRAQKSDPRNWGYVGDLDHVKAQLAGLEQHLASAASPDDQ